MRTLSQPAKRLYAVLGIFIVTGCLEKNAASSETAGGTVVIATTGDADVLEVEVKGADVMFRVNGTEVAKLPKAQLHTDGLVGFRIGHNIDVDIDQVTR